MNITILGCGWLGLPLAESLVNDGHQVKGSTTSPQKISKLNNIGVEPYLLTLNPKLECKDCNAFWESDLLFLNIPPGRGRSNLIDFHTTQVAQVIERLKKSPISSVIFASSTSVYPEMGGVVEEEDAKPGSASRDSGVALLQAESLLSDQSSFDTTILRFGGLYGYGRNPVNYLAGKQNLDHGCAPVNLIHRDDCINIIQELIKKDIQNGIYNAVSDGHPPRRQYYTDAAKEFSLEPPTFKGNGRKGYKVVSNKKLKAELDYSFTYPNPMDFQSP